LVWLIFVHPFFHFISSYHPFIAYTVSSFVTIVIFVVGGNGDTNLRSCLEVSVHSQSILLVMTTPPIYRNYINSSKEVEKRFKNFMDLIFIYQQKRATDDETKPIFYNFGKEGLLTIYAYLT
jgi:hypothetical protein